MECWACGGQPTFPARMYESKPDGQVYDLCEKCWPKLGEAFVRVSCSLCPSPGTEDIDGARVCRPCLAERLL